MSMEDSDDDRFRIRPGRPRDRGTRVNPRSRSFRAQVKRAVAKAGGNPNRFGGTASKASGRFNARGRGGKVVQTFPRDGGGWNRDESGTRSRARRVVVKARVVKLGSRRGPKMSNLSGKAVDAHLRYLERDGVTKEGEKGRVYSATENAADGRAFVERGRGDRHQFRFIVAPEDSVEMDDLRGFTRDLMRQMERDLATRLDWIAIDHHNTGHPHTHVILRGMTDDGKILNIAGDYIAYGVRHRASELVTLELGQQTELEVVRKLANEVDAERLTRLDRMLIAEQQAQGIVDLRADANANYLVRANRHLLIDRTKRLERYGLATETEPGRWMLAEKTENTLRRLGERNDIVKTMHRALADHGIADDRGLDQISLHGRTIAAPIVGRVLAKGLAGDEMGETLYLVIDGVDGRVHHVEIADHGKLEEINRGHIVALDPVLPATEPRPSDRNIREMTDQAGIYRPSVHLESARQRIEHAGGDPEAFIRSHIRRLEALRRAGHVERIDEDHWKVPADIAERGLAYDVRTRGKDFAVRTLATLDLDRQVASDGATWLDRELVAHHRAPLTEAGFGREVGAAIARRKDLLVERGHVWRAPDGGTRAPSDLVTRLERQEIARVGPLMAAKYGRTFQQSHAGDSVSGTLIGAANLASGRFAMIETFSGDGGLGFSLVPWQSVLDRRIGQHVTGIVRDGGGIDWSFGRRRGLGV